MAIRFINFSLLKYSDFWTRISIFITFLRIPLTGICVYFIFKDLVSLSSILIISIILLDILDGRVILLSKILSEKLMEVRHNTDAIIDRFIIQILLLTLLLSGYLAFWIYLIFKIREILLIILVSIIFKNKNSVGISTYSRIATFLMGIICIISLNKGFTYIPGLVLLFSIFSFIGLWEYYKQVTIPLLYSRHLTNSLF